MSEILGVSDLYSQNSTCAIFILPSETTLFPLENITIADGIVRSESSNSCLICEGVLISLPDSSIKGKVTYPFSIQVLPVEDGYIATSVLSDICELETTRGQVVRSYLSSLLDELIWLQEKKRSLSNILLKELERIESYLEIV